MMNMRIKQYGILAFFVFMTFRFLNIALAESTTVTSSGIKFPDGTTQTTAASGGGSSVWSQSGSSIFYNAGYVGIGTTSPGVKLEVNGLSSQSVAKFNLVGANYDTILELSSDDGEMGPYSNFLKWSSAETGLGVIRGDGHVGIGTTSPSEELEVAGTVKATAFEGDGSALTGISGGGDASYGSSASSPDDVVYVDNSGNVGISTTNPVRRLHLLAPIYHPQLCLQDENGSWELQAGTNFHILQGTGGENTKFFVANNGSVGIGTESPGVKLEINGVTIVRRT